MYLVSWFVRDYCRLKKSDPKLAKKNKQKGSRNDSEKAHSRIQNIVIDCMSLFNEFLNMELHYCWQEQKIEDEFVNLFVKTGFDMLENLN